jgi:outer membrane cobalamin receptor
MHRNTLKYIPVVALVFFLFPFSGNGQVKTSLDSAAIDTMSLDRLTQITNSGISSDLEADLNSGTEVASIKSIALRKSPGIVSIITQEEIEKSGARDLIDVLRLVPGIDFGVDVQGVVSIGMRGDWAHEGKLLFLLDGQEMNETLYSTIQLGNHFDVNQIKRIEIIRGPGSAIYGGFSEYLVISIITKSGKDLHGVNATGSYGQMVSTYGYRDISVSVGDHVKDFDFNLAAFGGQGNRGDGTYTDFSGNSYNIAGNAALDPMNINLGMSYKGLSFRGIYDNYQTTTRDNFGPAMTAAYPCNFTSEYLELKYNAKLSDKIVLTPLFSFKQQMPWNFTGTVAHDDSNYGIYDKTAQRYRGSLTMSYDITKKINLIAGGEIYYDYAKDGIDSVTFSNGERHISYINRALYVQSLFRFRLVNVILGARYDNNSGYEPVFSPRVGLIKRIHNVTLKLLFNQAFRSPGIEDIDYSLKGNIKPEVTQVGEFEAGYEITPDMYITLNVFNIVTKNPIVYTVDSLTDNEGYVNLTQQGSRGAELDYRIKSKWGYLDFNYSYYTVAGQTIVPNFTVPMDNSMTLGFASNKFNIYGCYELNKNISIAPTISYIGKRYGYAPSSDSTAYVRTYNPTVLVNLFITFNHLFTPGLKVGVGCYNMLNSYYSFIQPYMTNVLHPALPGPSREFAIKLTYDVNFKK